MTDYHEIFYRKWDETRLNQLIYSTIIFLILSLAVLMVLDSYQASPGHELNVSEFYDNETKQCISPEILQENELDKTDFSEYVCEPEQNQSGRENFSTTLENPCGNTTSIQGNETSLLNDSSGVYCKVS